MAIAISRPTIPQKAGFFTRFLVITPNSFPEIRFLSLKSIRVKLNPPRCTSVGAGLLSLRLVPKPVFLSKYVVAMCMVEKSGWFNPLGDSYLRL